MIGGTGRSRSLLLILVLLSGCGVDRAGSGPDGRTVDSAGTGGTPPQDFASSTRWGVDSVPLVLWPIGVASGVPTPGSVVRPTTSFVLYRRGVGERIDTILELPSRSSYVTEDRSYVRLPFTVGPLLAAGDSTIWAGTVEAGTLVHVDESGAVLAELEIPPGEAIPEERMDREGLDGRMPLPSTYPPFDQVLVDDEARVWVRSCLHDDAEAQEWTVREVDGQVVGVVHLTRALTVSEVTNGVVVGVWRDAFDV